MSFEAGEIRRSSVIQTFGPGSIVDFRVGKAPVSGIHAGLEEWEFSAPEVDGVEDQRIYEPRLMQKLGKSYFRLAPVYAEEKIRQGKHGSLVAKRFPEWLQCPKCSRLQRARDWSNNPGKADKFCATCTNSAVGKQTVFVIPVRFVVACLNGHLEDFPWHFWVRHKKDYCSKSGKLTLTAERIGLEGLMLRCADCGAARSMKTAFTKTALAGLNCHGSRPWLRSNEKSCDCKGDDGSLRVIQRAGSNAYYPVIASALDIPPWTKTINRILGNYRDDLLAIDESQRVQWVQNAPILRDRILTNNLSVEQVIADFSRAEKMLAASGAVDLKIDEYAVFTSGQKHDDKEFACTPQKIPSRMLGLVRHVSRVTRLREIRVLRGFTRINPPFEDNQKNISPISDGEMDWLPAMELKGEGIFFSMDIQAVLDWAKRPQVVSRYHALNDAWIKKSSQPAAGTEVQERTSPLFYLVHSIAHAVMGNLTLRSGYASASLRERIFVSSGPNPMAGVLIYTGAADADGTLGGLQNQGRIESFEHLLNESIRSTSLCSSDPLCLYGAVANSDSFSLASCHACLMVPETSCEFNNRFLDRASLTGGLGNFEGYFYGAELWQ